MRTLDDFILHQCGCLANQFATTVDALRADFVETVAFIAGQVWVLPGSGAEHQAVDPGIHILID